jgi:uncharacterized protein (DUF2164 family)
MSFNLFNDEILFQIAINLPISSFMNTNKKINNVYNVYYYKTMTENLNLEVKDFDYKSTYIKYIKEQLSKLPTFWNQKVKDADGVFLTRKEVLIYRLLPLIISYVGFLYYYQK